MNKLDPRTKLVIMLCISLAAMMTDKVIFQLGLLIFTTLFMAAGGIHFREQKKQLAGALSMVILLFVLQILFGDIETGLVLAIRLLIIVLSAMILLTGQARDYLLALVQWKIPYELAYMVILAFHFFPILREEALDVYYSIQLRGTELQKCSMKNKLSAYKKMCIPILAGAMERAKDTSVAMEARGFRAYRRRTYMRKLKLKKRDVVLMILFPLMAAVFIGCAAAWDSGDDSVGNQIILSRISDNTISVSWTSEEEYKGIVEFEDQIIEAECIEVKEDKYYRYQAELPGLETGQTYTYRVGNEDTQTKKREFTLEDEEGFSFLYIGDIQYQLRDRDYEIWGEFLEEAYKNNQDAAFGIFTGDMVEKGPDIDDWEAFFTNAESVFSKIPMMTTVGNHETSIYPKMYLQMMALPENGAINEEVYSFDYENAHFVALNSCLFMDERKGEENYEETIAAVSDWLKEDLNQTDAKWKIVYMHHPMYPVSEDVSLYSELRMNWEQIFKDEGVDLVLCGHQHLYMRTEPIDGITYIMANSGEKRSYYMEEGIEIPEYVETLYETDSNYLRIDVEEDHLSVEAYNEFGEKIDSYELEKE